MNQITSDIILHQWNLKVYIGSRLAHGTSCLCSQEINPLSSGDTYMVHKKPIFLSTPGLQGLKFGLGLTKTT